MLSGIGQVTSREMYRKCSILDGALTQAFSLELYSLDNAAMCLNDEVTYITCIASYHKMTQVALNVIHRFTQYLSGVI